MTNKRSYRAEQIICKTGDPGDYLRIVQAGSVMLERDGVSRELRYCDYFGEGALLTDGAHVGTATAASRVELIEIATSEVKMLKEKELSNIGCTYRGAFQTDVH